MIPQQNGDVTFGAMRLVIPPDVLAIPSAWDDLAFVAVLEDAGYDDIAREQLERLGAFLREPAFPGEAVKREGRKLTEGVRFGDEALTWYVLRCATRREKDAEESLIDAGFVCYLPREARIRRKAGKKYRVEQALLPGYIFAGLRSIDCDQLGHDTDFNTILGTGDQRPLHGIHDFVRSAAGRRPVRAPFLGKESISALVHMEIAGDFDRARKVKEMPEKDTLVTVDRGKFQGWPAKFKGEDAKGRINLLMQMFGRWTKITLDRDDVAEVREED